MVGITWFSIFMEFVFLSSYMYFHIIYILYIYYTTYMFDVVLYLPRARVMVSVFENLFHFVYGFNTCSIRTIGNEKLIYSVHHCWKRNIVYKFLLFSNEYMWMNTSCVSLTKPPEVKFPRQYIIGKVNFCLYGGFDWILLIIKYIHIY